MLQERGAQPGDSVHRDLSHQGLCSGRVDNGVIYSENLDTITTKWSVDYSVICILVRDEGGRGHAIIVSPSLSLFLPFPWLLRKEGRKQRRLGCWAQAPHRIKQKSPHWP